MVLIGFSSSENFHHEVVVGEGEGEGVSEGEGDGSGWAEGEGSGTSGKEASIEFFAEFKTLVADEIAVASGVSLLMRAFKLAIS